MASSTAELCEWGADGIGEFPPTSLFLGGVFPYSGGWPVGEAVFPAFQLAIDEINALTDLLPFTQLQSFSLARLGWQRRCASTEGQLLRCPRTGTSSPATCRPLCGHSIRPR